MRCGGVYSSFLLFLPQLRHTPRPVLPATLSQAQKRCSLTDYTNEKLAQVAHPRDPGKQQTDLYIGLHYACPCETCFSRFEQAPVAQQQLLRTNKERDYEIRAPAHSGLTTACCMVATRALKEDATTSPQVNVIGLKSRLR